MTLDVTRVLAWMMILLVGIGMLTRSYEGTIKTMEVPTAPSLTKKI
jgi:hypothetical protein